MVAIGDEYATGCHDNGNVGLHVCAKFHEHTYTQCFMLIVKDKVMYVVIARGWLLLVMSMLRFHDDGNVGLYVCKVS